MSFFETLKAMGLFPNQQQAPQQAPQGQPGQPPQAPAEDPYGLDPATRRMLGFQTLGNVSQQLLALSQQMTPQQRASMMQNVDFTGGYQQNLYNAAQMKLAQRKMQKDDLETQRAEEARTMIAERIKATPPGRLRDAAMFYFQAGDLGKAGEVLFAQSQRFNPMTGEMETVDGMGNPIAGAPAAPGSIPAIGGSSGAPAAPTPPTASPAASGDVPPMPAAPEQAVDQLTTNWRRLLNDPNLTPTEARIVASQGSQKGAYDKYAEIVKNRQAAAQAQAGQDQQSLSNNRSSAEALTSKYEALAKSYDTIIGAGQRAAQLVTNGGMTASDKLATLYQFMKALDPEGAVRDGDVAMAQSIQATLSSLQQLAKSVYSADGTISEGVITQMAGTMARLANDAAGRKELKRIEMIRLAQGRQIPTDMVVPPDSGNQNLQAPIGIGIPRGPTSGPNQPITLQVTPAEKSDLENYSGNGG